ncbi:uncharacterized protein LOC103986544 isoform X1 [Musa acuminata AAA Group]|uniref:uncharacterized protein LOC103986544 isoform X1 n=1 Tax=Musa acuminata AAA Group TaxID=214697 RepID=UPI0031DC79AE
MSACINNEETIFQLDETGDIWILALCDFPSSYSANEIIREHEFLQDRLPRKHFKERKTKLLILTAQCLLRTGPQLLWFLSTLREMFDSSSYFSWITSQSTSST